MMKLVCGVILMASLGVNSLSAELLPAKTLKSISAKATLKAIADFKKDKESKAAYDEAKVIVSKRLNEVANEGFYNIVYVEVDDGTLYKELSKKKKDMLESILKEELKKLGYTVESAKWDSIMLHWAITWG
ncbi:MAG: Unknown protein [uncultured Thiotrichaceae bacterium]|uniref:Uncharacterized protein n=1 Tax=uncultured Thiotrichaceae bacterium TaxID=298394 RepID=A0A6S6S5N6_9GAMM|nr:MAG: Unknown protein [uncultured Thiotrichaceae bacterium]